MSDYKDCGNTTPAKTLTEAAQADIDTLTESMSAAKCKADHVAMGKAGKKSCPVCKSKLGGGGVQESVADRFEAALSEALGFDPHEHPRGRGGKFIDVLGKLVPKRNPEDMAVRNARIKNANPGGWARREESGGRQAWTNAQVVERGFAGKAVRNAGNSLSFHPAGHLTTVKSYDEPIAAVDLRSKVAHVNNDRYSMTTAHHQSRVSSALVQRGFKIEHTNREGIHKMLGVQPGPRKWPGMPTRGQQRMTFADAVRGAGAASAAASGWPSLAGSGRRQFSDAELKRRYAEHMAQDPAYHAPAASRPAPARGSAEEERAYGITNFGDRQAWQNTKPPTHAERGGILRGMDRTQLDGVKLMGKAEHQPAIQRGVDAEIARRDAAGVPVEAPTVPGTVATIDLRSKISGYKNPEAQVIRVLRAAPAGSVVHVTDSAIVTKQDTNRYQVVTAPLGGRGQQHFESTSAAAAMRALGRL
jgi:hypothetical protein